MVYKYLFYSLHCLFVFRQFPLSHKSFKVWCYSFIKVFFLKTIISLLVSKKSLSHSVFHYVFFLRVSEFCLFCVYNGLILNYFYLFICWCEIRTQFFIFFFFLDVCILLIQKHLWRKWFFFLPLNILGVLWDLWTPCKGSVCTLVCLVDPYAVLVLVLHSPSWVLQLPSFPDCSAVVGFCVLI